MVQGRPRPRKTLTELLPVTLPTAASAESLLTAADLLANVSGSEVPAAAARQVKSHMGREERCTSYSCESIIVPRATKVMAVMPSVRPKEQPKVEAMSPTMAVRPPMNAKATKKANQPPHMPVGGTAANKTWSSYKESQLCCMHKGARLHCCCYLPEEGQKVHDKVKCGGCALWVLCVARHGTLVLHRP